MVEFIATCTEPKELRKFFTTMCIANQVPYMLLPVHPYGTDFIFKGNTLDFRSASERCTTAEPKNID